jgi:hypothetical protein
MNSLNKAADKLGVTKEFPNNPLFFKQESISETLTIPEEKPDIEELISVIIYPEIVSLRIIDTCVGLSWEGQNLTGKKLIIEFELVEKVKYVADEPEQSVHFAHYNKKYHSVFVVVPNKINCIPIETLIENKKVIVKPYIENIYGKKLDKRRLFRNVVLMIDIIIIPPNNKNNQSNTHIPIERRCLCID